MSFVRVSYTALDEQFSVNHKSSDVHEEKDDDINQQIHEQLDYVEKLIRGC